MCGRRKHERDDPNVLNTYGDMSFSMVEYIASQLPDGITTQLHSNGEPTLYPRLGDAIHLFSRQGCLVSFDTNGKLLVEKASEIIDNVDTIAISVIQNDPEKDEQLRVIKEFLHIKGNRKPLVVIRLNGEQDETPYKNLGVTIAKRVLHHPMGSYEYSRDVTVPETGVCMDLLHRLSIDRFGNVSLCVRYDPNGDGIIGNVLTEKLDEIWNGKVRAEIIRNHLCGNRGFWKICSTCDFWGLPTGW
jgi:hypothetical protein